MLHGAGGGESGDAVACRAEPGHGIVGREVEGVATGVFVQDCGEHGDFRDVRDFKDFREGEIFRSPNGGGGDLGDEVEGGEEGAGGEGAFELYGEVEEGTGEDDGEEYGRGDLTVDIDGCNQARHA